VLVVRLLRRTPQIEFRQSGQHFADETELYLEDVGHQSGQISQSRVGGIGNVENRSGWNGGSRATVPNCTA